MARNARSLSQLADDAIATVTAADNRRSAERAIVKTASTHPQGEIGELLFKLAAELSSVESRVSYADLNDYLKASR